MNDVYLLGLDALRWHLYTLSFSFLRACMWHWLQEIDTTVVLDKVLFEIPLLCLPGCLPSRSSLHKSLPLNIKVYFMCMQDIPCPQQV